MPGRDRENSNDGRSPTLLPAACCGLTEFWVIDSNQACEKTSVGWESRRWARTWTRTWNIRPLRRWAGASTRRSAAAELAADSLGRWPKMFASPSATRAAGRSSSPRILPRPGLAGVGAAARASGRIQEGGGKDENGSGPPAGHEHVIETVRSSLTSRRSEFPAWESP